MSSRAFRPLVALICDSGFYEFDRRLFMPEANPSVTYSWLDLTRQKCCWTKFGEELFEGDHADVTCIQSAGCYLDTEP